MIIATRGIGRDGALSARVRGRLAAALSALSAKPVRAQAAFFDDNGPKGGQALRCALTVWVPFRPAIRVEHTAQTARLAFDGAFPVLERQLARYRELDRDLRRRPKKYFVAKRVLGEGIEPQSRSRRRRRAREG